jgi:hypothetical protein
MEHWWIDGPTDLKNLCIQSKLSQYIVDWLPDSQSEYNFDFNYSLNGFKSIWYCKYSHVSSDVQRINMIEHPP